MKRKGFTPTTAILVALLVGAVFMVSRVVTPPPAGPPPAADTPARSASAVTPPPTPGTPNAAGRGSAHRPVDEQEDPSGRAAMMKANMAKMKAQGGKTPPVKKFDPSTIETTSDFFRQNQPGQAGIEAMKKKVDAALAERAQEAAALKAKKEADAKAGIVTPPPSVPPHP